MDSLYDKLIEYAKDGCYPMHMPGHKRNVRYMDMINPYLIDITEIDGFDNLHDAKGILKEAQQRAADLYHSEDTYFLINGSTAGLLAGISACTKRGGRILMARNCHKAVYHAAFLNELKTEYMYPAVESEFFIHGGISAQQVKEKLLQYPDIQLVVITSPTYEGVVSDIEAIAEEAHMRGIPLLVDEAHGAHFGFDKAFPISSVCLGADVVIHSLHKTLPSFTQTALMHVNGNLADRDRVKAYLDIYQTSSPSYLLMAGIDNCTALLKKRAGELFSDYNRELLGFYQKMEYMKHIRLFDKKKIQDRKEAEIFDHDRSKLVLSVRNTNMTGRELYDILRTEFKIQMEMASGDYVLGMTSICDTEDGVKRLKDALFQIDGTIEKNSAESEKENIFLYQEPEQVMSVSEAFYHGKRPILLENSEGHTVMEYVSMYPPGIPVLVPGERITRGILKQLLQCLKSGIGLSGMNDPEAKTILVEGTMK